MKTGHGNVPWCFIFMSATIVPRRGPFLFSSNVGFGKGWAEDWGDSCGWYIVEGLDRLLDYFTINVNEHNRLSFLK